MPIPTPFHTRTAALCESHAWRDWSGYLAASRYEPHHAREYYAIRNAAALIDVSPLFKYEVRGPEALRLVDRLMTRDMSHCAIGQVRYSPWCDDDGQVIDDGTVARLAEDRFRITAADPNLAWFEDCGYGMQVEVEDVSEALAALALQGPNARQILQQVVADVDLEHLSYYHLARGRVGDISLTISRTGYTGDLGYELWVAPQQAPRLWDRLVASGAAYGLAPAGMLALDIARIEVGLIMIGVDYISARQALIPAQTSSPFELGLGWAVDMQKANFIGRQALLAEQQREPQWQLVGIEVDWEALERLYGKVDLTPRLSGEASRQAVPVYRDGRQVGQMTSHTFSPLLKKYIGLASVERRRVEYGARISVEATVEYTRQQASARLVRLPFFNPARKRA